MKLLFTRHGESQANIERIISNRDLAHPLTARGKAQALTLAEQLLTEGIVAIFASPILRARQTAQIISEQLGLPFSVHDALREFDCGIIEGLGTAEAWAAHETVIAAWADNDYAQRIPGGESFLDMERRFVPFVKQLIAQHGDRTGAILLISHGSLLHHMLPQVLDNIDRAFVRQHPLCNCACVRAVVTLAGINCVDWDGHKP